MVLLRGDTEVASWTLAGAGRPNLSLVDDLARLELAARRVGCRIRLRDASGRLCALLDLVGLADVVSAPKAGSVVEVSREPERLEQLGVQEAVESGDPAA